jgi:hypothetical protein
VKSGAISPDAKYLAYVDTKGMHIKVIETGDTQVFPQLESAATTYNQVLGSPGQPIQVVESIGSGRK